MELEESLLRLRESLGKWSLKVRISPLKAAEYRKSAGTGNHRRRLMSSQVTLLTETDSSLTRCGLPFQQGAPA